MIYNPHIKDSDTNQSEPIIPRAQLDDGEDFGIAKAGERTSACKIIELADILGTSQKREHPTFRTANNGRKTRSDLLFSSFEMYGELQQYETKLSRHVFIKGKVQLSVQKLFSKRMKKNEGSSLQRLLAWCLAYWVIYMYSCLHIHVFTYAGKEV